MIGYHVQEMASDPKTAQAVKKEVLEHEDSGILKITLENLSRTYQGN